MAVTDEPVKFGVEISPKPISTLCMKRLGLQIWRLYGSVSLYVTN